MLLRFSGLLLAALVAMPCSAGAVAAQETTVLFREDFNTLDNWKPFYFPKIKKHSTYAIEKNDGESYLHAESNASASAVVYKDSFNVRDYPRVRWRWKVDNIYQKADATTKAGDDFPLRIYVMFEYDPEKAGLGFGERVKYGFAKSLYGEYPPHSSLNYVWSSKEHPERIITNPYTDRAKDVLLRKGAALAGTWQEEEVNIIDDYEEAFGKKPPERARIAIMNDSDNTGEHSVSWVDYIEVF
jgi:hypothetical protein